MKDKKTLGELVREMLSAPPTIQQIGEMTGIDIFDMPVEGQNNICGSYTTMTTDMNRFNRVFGDLITKVKKHNK